MSGALAGILLAAAIGHAPMPAPAPMPVAPPTSPGPAPAPPVTQISPLLLGSGAGSSGAPSAGTGLPGSIDQQKLQSYRSSLLQERRALENEGVSPADPHYRDIQQQLLRLNGAGSR